MLYARTRAEVEAEIRDNIEAAEKWKKNLSDSGREAGERGANTTSKPAFAPAGKREKPTFEFTPQAEFRKQKISPSQAQGERVGPSLKDLGRIIAAQQGNPNIRGEQDDAPSIEENQKLKSTRGDDDEEGRQVITSAKNGQANVHTIQKKGRKISYHKQGNSQKHSNRPVQGA